MPSPNQTKPSNELPKHIPSSLSPNALGLRCAQRKHLTEDAAFQAIFDQAEIDGLQQLFDFFNAHICNKYMAFLKQIGETDERIQNYHNRITTLGSIGPSNIADLLINYDAYRIEDIRTKFIIAVHYLTLNDRLR